MTTMQGMLDNLEENYLEHFGKKGMRWGVRSKANASNKEVKLKGRAKTQAIKLSRYNTQEKMYEIKVLSDKFYGAKNSKEAKFFGKKADTKMAELLNSKDYAMSKKLTRGEKLYYGSAWGALAVTAAGMVINARYN
jgi:hypothetical protein